ncbi:MAG: hypothetical protein RIC19_14910, partial [Phaeodactylibacter sp.]|uniref:hypothetical protein n=1 Tax=Phaeodactylibacter sp. TaxID=1940289 RepID=UPI0032F0102E
AVPVGVAASPGALLSPGVLEIERRGKGVPPALGERCRSEWLSRPAHSLRRARFDVKYKPGEYKM